MESKLNAIDLVPCPKPKFGRANAYLKATVIDINGKEFIGYFTVNDIKNAVIRHRQINSEMTKEERRNEQIKHQQLIKQRKKKRKQTTSTVQPDNVMYFKREKQHA
jgi:hypothetical protein